MVGPPNPISYLDAGERDGKEAPLTTCRTVMWKAAWRGGVQRAIAILSEPACANDVPWPEDLASNVGCVGM